MIIRWIHSYLAMNVSRLVFFFLMIFEKRDEYQFAKGTTFRVET